MDPILNSTIDTNDRPILHVRAKDRREFGLQQHNSLKLAQQLVQPLLKSTRPKQNLHTENLQVADHTSST